MIFRLRLLSVRTLASSVAVAVPRVPRERISRISRTARMLVTNTVTVSMGLDVPTVLRRTNLVQTPFVCRN